ncbi:MAG: hypothetical protein ABW203_05625 [Novosphingobium sp.]
MTEPPWRLRGTPWENWLRTAPVIRLDPTGDDYHRQATGWLDRCPGSAAPLTDQQHDDLEFYLDRYRLELLQARASRPAAGMDKLLFPLLSLVGSVAGASIVTSLGLTAYAAASLIVPAGLALITCGYALSVVAGNIRSGRRWDLVGGIADRIAVIASTRTPPAQLPAPSAIPPISVAIQSDTKISAPKLRVPKREEP